LEAGRDRVQEVILVMRKNPYSLIDVNTICMQTLTSARCQTPVVVGVDVAKGELVACVVWPDGSFERPWRARSPSQVRLLVEKLLELNGSCPVTVAMESSGTYGDPLRQALTDAGVALKRVSAKAVKDYAETFDGVASQHDGKDAAIIGTLCLRGHASAWPYAQRSDEDNAIRYWVRKLDTAQHIKQVWCGKLESTLARHWPETLGLLALSSATLTGAVSHWGGPQLLAADAKAAERLGRLGGRYLSAAKIDAVIESARTSVGVRPGAWAMREMRETAASITRQRRRIQRCRRELRKLTRNHRAIQAQAPALGLITACVLWMCLGDAMNYPGAAAYRKAMGLNLKERSSGMHKGKLSISKRGQRLTRKWLYFSALRWMRDPSVKQWMNRKKQRDGGSGAKGAIAVMRRLALAAWHTGQGEVFDPAKLFPGAQPQRRRPVAKPEEAPDEVSALPPANPIGFVQSPSATSPSQIREEDCRIKS
jgi:transposase